MDNNVNNVNNNVTVNQTPTPVPAGVPVTTPVEAQQVQPVAATPIVQEPQVQVPKEQVATQPQQPVSPVTTLTGEVVDQTLATGAARTTNQTSYTAGNQGGNVKAVPIVPAPEKLLLKSKDSISKTINGYYNKLIVSDAMCPKCKKYFYKATQPDNTKVRCPNCLDDHLISEHKEAKTQYIDEFTEKLLFAGLGVIILGFFLYVDEIIRFLFMISLGLILCIPKLKLEYKFNKNTTFYIIVVLLVIPVIASILLK